MPEVYIVMAYDYEDVFVASVWTTREAAQKYADERNEQKRQVRYHPDRHVYEVIRLEVQGDERSAVARD